ncbi:unnamed protein product [Rotaria magnacalcarata]|uniref:Uncharacterized protein n=2 Tax=Rotaria magnacalcarata TaxID=392030 RepID=A0A820BNE1_9BILA|nr:unnamed protein product [Rotaria magnacalcarata]
MSYRGILSPIGSPHNENVTFSDSDVILTDSPPPDSHLHNFTCSKILILLETKPEQYIIIKNTGKHTFDCWTNFGFPAIVNRDGKAKRIEGFVSCQHCFSTYSFISSSTRCLNRHKCNNSKICQNIRPFSIMEDDGLRQLIQECISIGARYGNIDVNRVLRGADVTAEHVSTLANKHRCRITKVLAEPIENDAVTFCPDIWSDPIRQISYLCISVAFVDDQYQYRSYDLCCSPFEEEDKSSESIIAVLQKVLKRFGINDLSLNESSKAQNGSSSNSTDDNVKDLTNFDDSLFTIGNIDEISFIDVSKINIKDLPDYARDVIKGFNNCKVKLNGLNKEIQSEGDISMKFFRLRLLELLETMFVLEPIDFVAAFLHPSYVRRQLKEINERELRKQSLQRHPFEEIIEETGMVQKSKKRRKRFGEEYESGNLSDEYGDSEDEVDKYLAMHIDPKTVVDNPLIFFPENQKNLPL